MAKSPSGKRIRSGEGGYDEVLAGVVNLLEEARRSAARSVSVIMTATYWEIGRRIVEFEQEGMPRAEYGKSILDRLSKDLTSRFGRGFSQRSLRLMRGFYLNYQNRPIWQTASGESPIVAVSGLLPLPWSYYVRLLAVKNARARDFYEREALRNGWSVRQLNRQIGTQFYERTALSRNRKAMLESGAARSDEDTLLAEIDEARRKLAR